jgi:hypothetical protein
MKKALLVVLFALLAMSVAMAQAFTPGTDTLGAHNNGGRGCAGCHAPHSGGRGSGGQQIGTGVSTGGTMGDDALWGTDVSIITSQTILSGDGGTYAVNFGGAQQLTATSSPLISGIAVCLSCHDGNVSKGAMMMGQSYEQAAGLLPTGHGVGTTTGALYGAAPIPTLLGGDGGTAGDYTNDHPIGPAATITAVASSAGANLTYALSSNGTGNSITWTVAGNYATFVGNYGFPAVNGAKVDGVNRVPYVVCTTCHNQHIMNVYKSGAAGNASASANGIQAAPKGSTYATYFFINAPYNPGSAWSPTAAPSTTQFCRECHFSHANEYYGVSSVTTAF